MKWAVFIAALCVGVPGLIVAMRMHRLILRAVLVLFFVVLLNDLGNGPAINVVSCEWYRGSSRGMEISVLDLIAAALCVHACTHRPAAFRRQWLSWNGILFLLFALSAAASMCVSFMPLYAWFSVWKTMRGLLVYFVFTQLIDRRERVQDLMFAFALACLYQLPFVLKQKYLIHMYRATGTLPHMNTLAMSMNMLAMPILAMLLIGSPRALWRRLPPLGAAAFNVVATCSRGALISMGIGGIICLAFLRPRHLSASRLTVLGGLGVGALAGGAMAARTIINRFESAPKESEETRHCFNDAAEAIAAAFPLGIGPNNFSYAMGHTRWGEPAPDLPDGSKDDGIAHHIYLLTAAEQGYIGLATLLLMIAGTQWQALKLALTSREPLYQAAGIGMFAGLATLHLQGLLEWILQQTNVWFLFCAQAGALTAICRLSRVQRIQRRPAAARLEEVQA